MTTGWMRCATASSRRRRFRRAMRTPWLAHGRACLWEAKKFIGMPSTESILDHEPQQGRSSAGMGKAMASTLSP